MPHAARLPDLTLGVEMGDSGASVGSRTRERVTGSHLEGYDEPDVTEGVSGDKVSSPAF